MISKRLRQHTITLYTYTGETDGKATYSRTVIAGVFLEKDYQHVMARRGITTKDVAQVVIDLTAVTVATTAEFTANSFFCEGTVTDTIPASTKQAIAAARPVYTISRVYFPPCGRPEPVIMELYGR